MLVESARFIPTFLSIASDAISPLGHKLITNSDLFVPAINQRILLQARHELVKRRPGPANTVFCERIAKRPSGLLCAA